MKQSTRLSVKISGIVIMMIALLTILSSVILYNTITKSTEETISKVGTDVAQNLANKFDVATYEQFLQSKTEDETYWQLREQLNDLREKSNVLYAYTMELNENNEVILLIDGMPKEEDELAAEIGEVTDVTTYEHVKPVLEGKTSYTEIVIDPQYGDFLSALAPLKNSNGDVIGILGVDIDAEQIDDISADVTKTILPLFIITMLIIAAAAIIFLVVYVTRQLKPIGQIQNATDEISQGNLEKANEIVTKLPLHKNDEIGQLSNAIHRMIQQLQEIIQQVTTSSTKISSSSDELATNADALLLANKEIEQNIKEVAVGSTNQLHSTKDSARGMEEITMNVQQISENAFAALDTSQHTLQEAEQGKEAVEDVLKQMNHITEATEKISNIIEQLDSHSNEIENILTMITDIAEQTNLLALNAAIEAARAGEHGKGFAVVSDEIRKLADESKASTEKISKLIHMINHDTGEAIEAMQLGQKEAREGSSLVKNMRNAFEAILNNIQKVTEQVRDVSSSTNQITAETEEITSNIDGLASIANETSNNTNVVVDSANEQMNTTTEISKAANDLKQISSQLEDLITRFKA